jgi:hypothetical protein
MKWSDSPVSCLAFFFLPRNPNNGMTAALSADPVCRKNTLNSFSSSQRNCYFQHDDNTSSACVLQTETSTNSQRLCAIICRRLWLIIKRRIKIRTSRDTFCPIP